MIYKEGPAFYHGSYSVIVKMVVDEEMMEDPRYQTRDLTWTNLAGLNRLTEQVGKVCYINLWKESLNSDGQQFY